MITSLKKLISSTMEDIANRNYWLVRTYSGNYYEQFRNHNFIGIGWNEITLNDMSKIDFKTPTKELKHNRKTKLNLLASKVQFPKDKDFASDESKANAGVRAIHQIWTFIKELKKGDIVIIPSENSDYYSFGEIEESSVILASSMEINATNCDLIKRKKIKWIKFDYPREKLDSNYLKFLRVQSTITKISDYKYFVEKTISNTFILNSQSYFVLNVKRREELYPSHYRAILKLIEETEKLILLETGDKIEEIEIKSNVQSEGDLILISNYLPYIFYFAFTVLILAGAGVKFIGLEFNTKGVEGLVNKILNGFRERTEFKLNQEQERKNQETIRKAFEVNPDLIKECKEVAIKLLDHSTSRDLKTIQGDNDIE